MRKLFLLLPLCVGCGGAASEPASPAKTARTDAPAAAPAPASPIETLERAKVLATVEAGLGLFLQRVEVEPALRDGRFTGFRIVELYPAEYWSGVDLRPGDVVTRVNGMPIERETEAYAAFESLRSAAELRVSLVRDGKPVELVLPILEGGKRPAGAPSPKGSADADATG